MVSLYSALFCLMVSRLRPLARMIRIVLRTRRSWKIIRMVLTSAMRGNVCVNVTATCVCVTILAVESNKYYIL